MRFERADVAVVGMGPAGRAVAHRLLVHGARVVVVDPAPQRPWWQTYAGWQWQLPSWLDASVVGARCGRPVLRGHAGHVLGDEYLVLDTAALQQQLDLSGARQVAELVHDEQLADLAPVVVDARGSHPLPARTRRDGQVAVQSAYGVVLEADRAEDLLAGATAVLMDWRPHDGSASWGRRRPSFCYLIPLPDGRVLVEETSLAARPAMDRGELRHRLVLRLGRHGVSARELAGTPTERVHIPLQARARRHGSGPATIHPVGAAGPQLNPISGYTVFASLAQADRFAQQVLADEPPRGRRLPDPRRVALPALDRLSGDATMALFDGFGRLSAERQRAVMDLQAGTGPVLAAMGTQWWRMPARFRPALVAATVRGAADAGSQR